MVKKAKILYLMKILLDKTDNNHFITMVDIKRNLELYGITAERKTIYNDIETLRQFGLNIVMKQEANTYTYHVEDREFDFAEIRLLIDAAQSSSFLTEKQTLQLIKKLINQVSEPQRRLLNGAINQDEWIKTDNKDNLEVINKLYHAIEKNNAVSFQYCNWNLDKELEVKHGGIFYKVIPYEAVYYQNNYYLIGFDKDAEIIKHFRIDKIINVEIIKEKKSRYIKRKYVVSNSVPQMIGMYNGKMEKVSIVCKNELAGVFIDRFGKDIIMHPIDNDHFKVKVDVAISNQFIHWILSLGSNVEIVAPSNVLNMVKTEIRRLNEVYLD